MEGWEGLLLAASERTFYTLLETIQTHTTVTLTARALQPCTQPRSEQCVRVCVCACFLSVNLSCLSPLSKPLYCVPHMKTKPKFHHSALCLVFHIGLWCGSLPWAALTQIVSNLLFFFTSSLNCTPLFLLLTLSLPLLPCLYLPLLSTPDSLGLDATLFFAECPFVDYSPRNHVAQLKYQWLQRLHLPLRHLEDALVNQPITAGTSMIPAHKETLLFYP